MLCQGGKCKQLHDSSHAPKPACSSYLYQASLRIVARPYRASLVSLCVRLLALLYLEQSKHQGVASQLLCSKQCSNSCLLPITTCSRVSPHQLQSKRTNTQFWWLPAACDDFDRSAKRLLRCFPSFVLLEGIADFTGAEPAQRSSDEDDVDTPKLTSQPPAQVLEEGSILHEEADSEADSSEDSEVGRQAVL